MIGLMLGMEGRYWLNINKGKSYVLLYNHWGIPAERVRGIIVVVVIQALYRSITTRQKYKGTSSMNRRERGSHARGVLQIVLGI